MKIVKMFRLQGKYTSTKAIADAVPSRNGAWIISIYFCPKQNRYNYNGKYAERKFTVRIQNIQKQTSLHHKDTRTFSFETSQLVYNIADTLK